LIRSPFSWPELGLSFKLSAKYHVFDSINKIATEIVIDILLSPKQKTGTDYKSEVFVKKFPNDPDATPVSKRIILEPINTVLHFFYPAATFLRGRLVFQIFYYS
jgi:hypothetical protein